MADPKSYYIAQGRINYVRPPNRYPFGKKGEDIPVSILPKVPAPDIVVNTSKKYAKPSKKSKPASDKPEKKPVLTRLRHREVRDYSPPNLTTTVANIARIRETVAKMPMTKSYIERYLNKEEEKVHSPYDLCFMTYATMCTTNYNNSSFLKYIDYFIENYESRNQILNAMANEYKYRLIFWLGIQPYAAHELIRYIYPSHNYHFSPKLAPSLNSTSYYLDYRDYKDYLTQLGFNLSGRSYLEKLLREIDTTMMHYLKDKGEVIHLYADNNNPALRVRKSQQIFDYCKRNGIEPWEYDGELGFDFGFGFGAALAIKAPNEFLIDLDDEDKHVFEVIGVDEERDIPDYLSPDAQQNLQTIYHNLKLRTFDEYLRNKYHVPGSNHPADIYPPTTDVGHYINEEFKCPDHNTTYEAHSSGRLIIKYDYSLADLIYYYGTDDKNLDRGLDKVVYIPRRFTRYRGDSLKFLFRNEFVFRMILEHGCYYPAINYLANNLITEDGTGGFINMEGFMTGLNYFRNIQAKREVARIMHEIIAQAKEICREHEWDREDFKNDGRPNPFELGFEYHDFVNDDRYGVFPRYQYQPFIEVAVDPEHPFNTTVVDIKDKFRFN